MKIEEIEEIEKIFTRKDEGTIKWLKNRYTYDEIGENEYLEIPKAKDFTITKTFYYNDETTGPKKDFETFLKYNERNNEYNNIKNNIDDYYFILFKIRDTEDYKIYKPIIFEKEIGLGGRMLGYCKMNEEYIIGLNVEFSFVDGWHKEIKGNEKIIETIFKKILEENENYKNRLTRYYKRYGKHLRTSGYWANR